MGSRTGTNVASILEPLTSLQLILDLFVDQRVVHHHVNHGGILSSPVVLLELNLLFQHGKKLLVQRVQFFQVSNRFLRRLKFLFRHDVRHRWWSAGLVKSLEARHQVLVANGSLGSRKVHWSRRGLVLFVGGLGSRHPRLKLVELGSHLGRASPDFASPVFAQMAEGGEKKVS